MTNKYVTRWTISREVKGPYGGNVKELWDGEKWFKDPEYEYDESESEDPEDYAKKFYGRPDEELYGKLYCEEPDAAKETGDPTAEVHEMKTFVPMSDVEEAIWERECKDHDSRRAMEDAKRAVQTMSAKHLAEFRAWLETRDSEK